ncbi:MAG: DUF6261 family protein [Prevotellaceae bacterium]|jgi:hypothetical protein|nr:DUF6261 family protein [Prevotellaceae bacterium]
MEKYIQRVDNKSFRGKTHFEFMTEIGAVLKNIEAIVLKIAAQVKRFFELLADEDATVVLVRKYETTDEISELDAKRDNLLKGINNLLKAALKHFDPAVRDAAEKLMIVFNTYGEIARLSYDDETAAIYNLIQELDLRSSETAATGITAWIEELRHTNEEFRALMESRYSEEAKRVQIKLRNVRKEIDDVYNDIVYRLEAGANLDGTEQYTGIFAEINARVSRYANILAQEKGRRTKKN